MAGRTLNRRELRRQSDQADLIDQEAKAEPKAKAKADPKAKAAAPAKPKRVRKKKAPARMCARWGVFDAAMKQVAVFDYNQRGAADLKLAEMRAKKNTEFFLQVVKEPMPEPEAPPEEPAPAKPKRKAAAAPR